MEADDLFDHLHDNRALTTLTITESGTTGMYGPWEGGHSKMFLALISLGMTEKAQGSGGSYGYGKAGLIRGSAIRMVVAYTAFRERLDDPGVTRRLLGMTYWGQHDLNNVSYTGFGRFGTVQDFGVVPFINNDADRVAERLGLNRRDPDDVADLGTTFLLIEPTVKPDDLLRAIERNWWPAIDDSRLTVMITADDGTEKMPRPMQSPVLRTFIDAYHLATTKQDNPKPAEYRQPFRRLTVGDDTYELGNLGILSDTDGWSYEAEAFDDDDSVVQHRSLIALVRGPRMVVEYYDAGRTQPFVRGVFVADTAVDELLRQTEPKGHDAWQTGTSELTTDSDALQVAGVIRSRVRQHVAEFRKKLRPASRPAEHIRLPEFERLMARILSASDGRPRGPDSEERPFSITMNQIIREDSAGQIFLDGSIGFALSEHHDEPTADVEVSISYRFVEDGRRGDAAELVIDPPPGFSATDSASYRFQGRLGHERVRFNVRSVPYSADWTGKLRGEAHLVDKVLS